MVSARAMVRTSNTIESFLNIHPRHHAIESIALTEPIHELRFALVAALKASWRPQNHYASSTRPGSRRGMEPALAMRRHRLRARCFGCSHSGPPVRETAVTTASAARLLAELGGGQDQVGADAEEHHDEASPAGAAQRMRASSGRESPSRGASRPIHRPLIGLPIQLSTI